MTLGLVDFSVARGGTAEESIFRCCCMVAARCRAHRRSPPGGEVRLAARSEGSARRTGRGGPPSTARGRSWRPPATVAAVVEDDLCEAVSQSILHVRYSAWWLPHPYRSRSRPSPYFPSRPSSVCTGLGMAFKIQLPFSAAARRHEKISCSLNPLGYPRLGLVGP